MASTNISLVILQRGSFFIGMGYVLHLQGAQQLMLVIDDERLLHIGLTFSFRLNVIFSGSSCAILLNHQLYSC